MTNAITEMLLQGHDDLDWFNSNLPRLLKRYNNRFIAFHNQQILESDPNLDRLMTKLKQKEIDTSNVFIKFVSRIKSIL